MHKTAKWEHKMISLQEVYIESALGIRIERYLFGLVMLGNALWRNRIMLKT